MSYIHYNIIILLNLALLTYCAAPDEGDSCYSYAGGSVYPTVSNPEKAEHKLQWTKAVSKSTWISRIEVFRLFH